MALKAAEQKISSLSMPGSAPEILVDGFNSVSIVNDVARLNFFSMQAGVKGGAHAPTLVCRMALSLSALVQLRKQMNLLVEDLIKQGLIKEKNDADK